jgi:hypothetical protein
MIDMVGGRKVLIVCATVVTGVALVWWKGDVPTNFLELLKWIIPSYILGNVGSKFFGAPSSETDLDGVAAAISEKLAPAPAADYGPQLQELQQAQALTNQALSLIIRKYGIDRLPDPRG